MAISAQPVVASDTYALDGYFKGVLIVGSFHVVQEADGQQVILRLQLLQLHTRIAARLQWAWLMA